MQRVYAQLVPALTLYCIRSPHFGYLWYFRYNPLTPRLIGGGNHCKCGTCFHTRQHNYIALLILSRWKYYAVSLRLSVS